MVYLSTFRLTPRSTLFPYTTLFRSDRHERRRRRQQDVAGHAAAAHPEHDDALDVLGMGGSGVAGDILDRKSTRLNSSHSSISYAVFCLKKKTKNKRSQLPQA